MGDLIYLAAPYSHRPESVRHHRYMIATIAAADLTLRGYAIFSPITHSHNMARICDLPSNWAFWERIDRTFLSRCSELWVLTIEGWKTSTGVLAEIKIAEELGLPVKYLDPVSLEEVFA